MNKITALILVLVTMLSLFSGCIQTEKGSFDYKESYERLYKDVVEHGYAIEDLTDNAMRKYEDEICVCFGDSVTGGKEPPSDYPTVISHETGMTTVNAGFGGVRISAHPYPEVDAFSLYRLADAIATDNWTLQDQYVSELPLENSQNRYDALRAVNWSEVDFITISYGSMDISGQVPLDNPEDPKSVNTVKGALRYSLERIQTTYPHIKILILTPMYRYWIEEAKDSDQMIFAGLKYTDYVDAIIQVAQEYKLPYVDMYRTLGINSVNRFFYFDENDGFHPNANGISRIGERVSAALMNEF